MNNWSTPSIGQPSSKNGDGDRSTRSLPFEMDSVLVEASLCFAFLPKRGKDKSSFPRSSNPRALPSLRKPFQSIDPGYRFISTEESSAQLKRFEQSKGETSPAQRDHPCLARQAVILLLRLTINFLPMFVNLSASVSVSALILSTGQTAGEIFSNSLFTLLVNVFIRRSRRDRPVESERVNQRRCALDYCQVESLAESHRAT